MTAAPDDAGAAPLVEALVRRIRAEGPLPFAAFMEAALHDPEHGYYARGPQRLGRLGDFFTASDVGRAFGACVARQLAEMDAALGAPDPFHVVEFGAGRGLLARDVLDAADPAFASRLRYRAVERSAGMRARIAEVAPEVETVDPERAGDGGEARVGCALAVELLDALPVHRLRRRATALVEVAVDVGGADDAPPLVEREVPAAPEVAAEAERDGLAARDGDEAEVCLALGPQLHAIAASLARGFLVVVDYGHDAASLAGPAHRRGTLLAYHRHRTSEAYLERVGEQDLTAHVNWTALDRRAREAGFEPVGATTQDRFLIANGILERFDDPDDAAWRDPARVRGRMQALQLIHPHGMGRAFGVRVFARGLDPVPALAGLADPFARDP